MFLSAVDFPVRLHAQTPASGSANTSKVLFRDNAIGVSGGMSEGRGTQTSPPHNLLIIRWEETGGSEFGDFVVEDLVFGRAAPDGFIGKHGAQNRRAESKFHRGIKALPHDPFRNEGGVDYSSSPCLRPRKFGAYRVGMQPAVLNGPWIVPLKD
jgi:hypothetical protein